MNYINPCLPPPPFEDPPLSIHPPLLPPPRGIMSRRVNRQNPELDLKLNLSPPRAASENRQPPSPEASPPSSCVSSEDSLKYSSSPEATSMVLVGCPRCLMYVMLSESDPKCPKCKSTVLLDFLRDDAKKKARN